MTRSVELVGGMGALRGSLLVSVTPLTRGTDDGTDAPSSQFRQLMEEGSQLADSDDEAREDSASSAGSRGSESGSSAMAFHYSARGSRTQAVKSASSGPEDSDAQPSGTKASSGDALLQGVDFNSPVFAPRLTVMRGGFSGGNSNVAAGETDSSSETDEAASSTAVSKAVEIHILGAGQSAAWEADSGEPAESANNESSADVRPAAPRDATVQAQAKGRAGVNPTSMLPPPLTNADAAAPQQAIAPVPEEASKEDSEQEEGESGDLNARRATEAPAEWNLDGETSTATGSGAPVAFEAKLSVVAPASGEDARPQMAMKQPAAPVADPADDTAPVGAAANTKPEILFKTEALAAGSSSIEVSTPGARTTPAPATAAPSATHLEPMIEAPSAAAPRHTISVNVADGTSESNVNLRFVERGGEIHVSVRSADAELAQDLRGGLSELTRNLEHAGIRTEIAAPVSSREAAADSGMQRDSQQTFSEQRGSGRQTADSQREQQESRQPNSSRWKQAYEESAGENSQEQSQ